jgi:hypothetical protein
VPLVVGLSVFERDVHMRGCHLVEAVEAFLEGCAWFVIVSLGRLRNVETD